MSVFTSVDRRELEKFLLAYELGALERFAGIESGIENTNYFVTTRRGRYVLTLFEVTPADELDYFLGLMAHLADNAVLSAHPVADRSGGYVRTLKGKPAALVARLPGRSVERPGVPHCAAIGRAMAQMHLAVGSFCGQRANDRGPAWRHEVAALLSPHVDAVERELLDAVIDNDARGRDCGALPGGVIHADLFRDNALFDGERLTGIIDFYYAHNGPFIYDLAVCVADWCFGPEGLDAPRAGALLAAYDTVRVLQPAERAAWPRAVCTAGARFWLSRLKDKIFPRRGALTHIKDPDPFRRVFTVARERPRILLDVWPH
ncbi:MAG: homoserine kinase [Gammaproteobacteria bacterium]